ncbi:MAG: glycosyltransferase [Gemmatimonas sp.]|jgi:glycosyltransferase involved in cell wall biosynthesis|uniref:glycosyltransferase n=1 Tax=Gemmatimonas sp. TaxID=1962908 RepID=UPI0022C8A2B4|nr:glycosyltransferase [Gemmatimonas sp.]MCE2952994.1 glycosyltransferase [Gemmatimonas sp.]MCZ8011753.1 glycosyltransferase [Gemmatimonas sp.]MCZ8265698.1 glycosyltransferase [Gemmatimonas sp.]
MSATTGTPDLAHVVHVVETLGMGGMERAIATLCRTLRARQIRTSVIAMKQLGAVADELRDMGVPVHLAGVPVSPPDYFAWRCLVPVLREVRPTVVHTHNSAPLIYGAPSARWCGVRRIVHTDHGRVLPDRRHIMIAERWAASVVHAMVAVSAPLAEQLAAHLHIGPHKLHVIVNGVNAVVPVAPAQRDRTRAAWFGATDGPIVGLAARLVWEKGLNVLLAAWPQVLAVHPGARLLIGGDGPERAALERIIEQQALGASVCMPGMVSDMAAFYSALDVFVLPSVSEGLPLALLEAMSMGLPIVASAVGGMPAALGPSQAGVLVPPSDVAALARALCETLDGLGRADGAIALGARARATFAREFTAEAMTSAYMSLYGIRT